VDLELIPTGSTGSFIEAYAGIDLHSSNNSSFAPSCSNRTLTDFKLLFNDTKARTLTDFKLLFNDTKAIKMKRANPSKRICFYD
jgi:hypothetical protein